MNYSDVSSGPSQMDVTTETTSIFISSDSTPRVTTPSLPVTTELYNFTNLTSSGVTTPDNNLSLTTKVDDYIYDYDYDASLQSLPLGEVIPVSLVYGFTLLFGLGGNALVIIVVLRNERLRSITNIFLTSLASADLILVLFCVPVKVRVYYKYDRNRNVTTANNQPTKPDA
ncbi:hypothetical protein BaRGS_00021256 [Batillaria attramentaria]|uniref:G-protein coupled receptors family 1 profile domain-containing protein n=1 Tax=Batillaria attramentaria TaxID=370345 RepID=A0ABD0KKC9_9CAEN